MTKIRHLLAIIFLAMLVGYYGPPLSAQSLNYDVSEPVFLIKQPKDNACWATVATMMKSWKSKQLLSIDAVLEAADKASGGSYSATYRLDSGLSSSDKPGFLRAVGLRAEPPASYTPQAIESKLRLWGPLWVTTAEPSGARFSIHARMVIGIMGDGSGTGTTLVVVDPSDGAKHIESFDSFVKKTEVLAKADYGSNADVRPLIVHF